MKGNSKSELYSGKYFNIHKKPKCILIVNQINQNDFE